MWSWAFLKTSLSLPSLLWVCTRFHIFSWHLHCVDGERVHICYGKLLPQMCPENPRSRSSCSLRKPSQMPGRPCEVSVIASQALPVQLRNSCVYNALHLLGCHKSWRTEGKLWNHIFPWLICWEGKHFRGKKKKPTTALHPSHFSHSSVQAELMSLWILRLSLWLSSNPTFSFVEASLMTLQHDRHPLHFLTLWCVWNSRSFLTL